MSQTLRREVVGMISDLPVGSTFTSNDIYRRCRSRSASAIAIGMIIRSIPGVVNTVENDHLIHVWQKVSE